MTFEFPGDGSLDYFPCRYGMSRVLFRGPRRDLAKPFVAVLGGTETYGKFVRTPYPALIEQATGLSMVNLGCVNAGLDLYLRDPDVLDTAARARLAVVQIIGAQNLSNRFYTVHPRRNDRFLHASPLLRSLFREVDFTDFNFTRHMLSSLHALSPDRFEVVADVLRAEWVDRMKMLLASLPCPTVLLWVGRAAPPAPCRRTSWSDDPLLIDCDMIDALRSDCTRYVQVVASAQALADGTQGLAFAPLETPAAQAVLGPAVHAQIADRLGPELLDLI